MEYKLLNWIKTPNWEGAMIEHARDMVNGRENAIAGRSGAENTARIARLKCCLIDNEKHQPPIAPAENVRCERSE